MGANRKTGQSTQPLSMTQAMDSIRAGKEWVVAVICRNETLYHWMKDQISKSGQMGHEQTLEFVHDLYRAVNDPSKLMSMYNTHLKFDEDWQGNLSRASNIPAAAEDFLQKNILGLKGENPSARIKAETSLSDKKIQEALSKNIENLTQFITQIVNTGDIQQHYSVTSDPYLNGLTNLAAGVNGNLEQAKETVKQLLTISEEQDRKELSALSGQVKLAIVEAKKGNTLEQPAENTRRHSAPPEAKAETKLREDPYGKRNRQFEVSKEDLEKVRKQIEDARSKKMPDRPPPEPPKFKR